jgi:hypothetical protein
VAQHLSGAGPLRGVVGQQRAQEAGKALHLL